MDPNYGTQVAQGVPFALAYEELFLELAKVAQQVGYQIRSGPEQRVLHEFNYENRTIPLTFDFGATGNFKNP